MSFTATETSRHHNFGHTMVDTMARPVNGWIPEPYAPRHMGYYPPEQIGQQLRLPPPSSLVSGAPGNHGPPSAPPPLHTNVKPTYGYHDYQTPSPIQQASPPLQPPTSQPHHHLAALAQQGRRHVQDLARVSPTLSSTTSERSADEFQDPRMVQNPQIPRVHNPIQRHRKGLSGDEHYVDLHAAKMPPSYPPPARLTQTPQPVSPQSRQAWSPRSESKVERVKISDLLSSDPQPNAGAMTTAPSLSASSAPVIESEYRITVRQQPVAARSCGFGERDRRVIDPPPIVQLSIEDPNMSPVDIARRIRHPFSVVHCSIWNETGEHDNSAMPEDYRQQRRLMGTLVASPFVGLDENGDEGCFFCFPDLSCRTPGSFRLKFVLVVLEPSSMKPGKRSPIRAQAMSDVFTVYNAKDFPGMQASTPLTKKLKEQGCLISIKKGNEKNTHGRDDSDEDEEEASGGGKRKRAKKN